MKELSQFPSSPEEARKVPNRVRRIDAEPKCEENGAQGTSMFLLVSLRKKWWAGGWFASVVPALVAKTTPSTTRVRAA